MSGSAWAKMQGPHVPFVENITNTAYFDDEYWYRISDFLDGHHSFVSELESAF